MKKMVYLSLLNKKGQGEAQQVILLAEFLLGIIITGILVYGAYQAGAKESVHRSYISADTGLILEAVYSVPGNVEIEMNIGDDEHEVVIGKDEEFNYYRVLVDGNEFIYAHDLILDKDLDLEFKIKEKVKIIKDNEGVKVEEGTV